MKRIVAFIYHMFNNDAKQTTPYFSTILLTALLIAMHLYLFILIFKIPTYVFRPINFENSKLRGWVNTIVFFTPILISLFCFYTKKKLELYEFNEIQLKSGRKKIILYMIVLLLLLIFFGLKKGVDEGLIKL